MLAERVSQLITKSRQSLRYGPEKAEILWTCRGP